MMKKSKMRRVCTVPSALTSPSTKKSDRTEFCDDRLSGWLQRPAGYTVCWDPPLRGHHTGFVCRSSLTPMGSVGERP